MELVTSALAIVRVFQLVEPSIAFGTKVLTSALLAGRRAWHAITSSYVEEEAWFTLVASTRHIITVCTFVKLTLLTLAIL